ncbi:MAG TPA: LysM peptidoglycan-binding domain-containing protein [Pyrinomonadaceae bacterium]|nr:LysM peptidoglycan-binding domain-containing protein [Pyrinomonadaceae bacterium]
MGGTSRIAATNDTGANGAETERRHTVRRGETLSGIAARYGVTVADLQRANPRITNPDRIRAGQSIVIPEHSSTADVQEAAVYTVRPGDTMTAIAARHGLDLARLRRANLQVANPNLIYPGQTLRVPARTTTTPTTPTTTPTTRPDNVTRTEETPPPQQTERGANGFARIDLDEFLRVASGSDAMAAIIIGNAEGTRTPDGGLRRAYYGHSDPGNARHNMGSFSYQNSRVRTPQEADRLQLTDLRTNIETYRRAATDAGLDPNDALLASAYFDALNQSPGAARRFLNQLDYLRENGITQATVTELRVRGFVNPETGERWRDSRGNPVGGGFANIARQAARRAGRTATEADIVRVVRADQARRVRDMVAALREQGLVENAAPVETNNAPQVDNRRADAPRHYTVRAGVVLSARATEVLNQIGDEYFRRTGREFTVTSGTRTPRAQARAMYNKLANGDDLSEYTNRTAVAEIRVAYDESRRAGRTADQTIAAMESVIAAQVARGTFISRHLRGNGADISLRGLDQPAFRASVAASNTGSTLLYEGTPPHFHLQW